MASRATVGVNPPAAPEKPSDASQPACIASGFVLPRFVISRFSAET